MTRLLVQECMQKQRDLLLKGEEPIRITFSEEAYLRAKKESYVNGGTCAFSMGPTLTYLGLPYTVKTGQKEDIVVISREADKKSSEAVTVSVKNAYSSDMNLSIVGKHLSKSQLCNIIQAWCEANPEDSLRTALTLAIHKHGSFE